MILIFTALFYGVAVAVTTTGVSVGPPTWYFWKDQVQWYLFHLPEGYRSPDRIAARPGVAGGYSDLCRCSVTNLDNESEITFF